MFTGAGVARLRVASGTRRRSGEEWVHRTNYFTVEVYGPLANLCAERLGEGSRIVVDGELEWPEWTDQEESWPHEIGRGRVRQQPIALSRSAFPMKHPTVTPTGSIRDRYDVIGRGGRDRLTPSPESFPMSDARIQSRDAPAAIEPLNEAAARALTTRRYTVLAALAAPGLSAPTVLHTSAPLLAVGRDSELFVTVMFVPASREFVAATAEDDVVREVFRGPSLTLACAAANQALEDAAPLPSAIRPSRRLRYSRTRPAYDQDVHFAEALRRLGELAGA